MGLDYWLWYSVRRKHLDDGLNAVGHQMRGRVLEVGAGHRGRRGEFTPPTEGVESWVFSDLDRNRLPDVQANTESLPFADNSYDTVVCLEVLEYVTEPAVALREFRRVLTDGGTLILSTPFFHRADDEHDFWRFTEYGLRHLLRSAGFEVEACLPQGRAFGIAANIFKYAIYCLPLGWRRRWLSRIAYPFLQLIWRADEWAMQRVPQLADFSTGYLVVAHAKKEQK